MSSAGSALSSVLILGGEEGDQRRSGVIRSVSSVPCPLFTRHNINRITRFCVDQTNVAQFEQQLANTDGRSDVNSSANTARRVAHSVV